jgi:hypothetical protein
MGRYDRELDVLRGQIDELEALQSRPPALGRTVVASIGALIASVVISISSPVVSHVLRDEPNPCSVQISDVSDALKAGIDDAGTLASLAKEGCSVTPAAVADDIRDNSAKPLPETFVQ